MAVDFDSLVIPEAPGHANRCSQTLRYGGMPWFNGDLRDPQGAGVLSDDQIASVVNYVRTHFSNAYTDPVSPADVAAVRGPAPITEH